MTPLISLDNAGVSSSARWLVRGVTFDVGRGEIVTMIGPNGSGKSTTAKLALGINAPDEGKVARADNLRVGYVPQKLSIDWALPLSVERFMSLTNPISKNELESALDRVGTLPLAKQQMRSLSGGEFQRVLLARAIARKPNLLVLDEPAQGVDLNGEVALYNLINTIRDELDCGVLMISHDLHLVMEATDQVVCLNGHMCCQGTPKSVSENPVYKDLFGGRAVEGLAVYEHQHDHTHLPDGRVKHADGTITDHCHPDDGHHHAHEHTTKERAHVG